MPSIRHKISFGFYAFAAMVALLAAFAYSDLRYLEGRVTAGTAVADFRGAVLELRRYEKNFFLYGAREDLETAAEFVDAANAILRNEPAAFAALNDGSAMAGLAQLLDLYGMRLREALGGQAVSTGPGQPGLQAFLRDLGRDLAEAAEGLVHAERLELAATAQRAQAFLLGAVVLAILLGIVAARLLSRTAVQPMAWLESKLAAIGEGRFNQVQPLNQDQEIVSMSRAVNRMLAEIDARNRQLAQSEKLASLGTLVSGVAHELNNPLSNISSTCQILIEELRQDSGVDAAEWLQQIDDETERARRIVSALLEFSRECPFEKQPVALRRLIERVLLLLGRHRRLQVQVDVADDITADADPQRLQQVLVNLIQNAQDAGGADLPIRVSARTVEGKRFHMPQGAVAGRLACPAGNAREVVVIEVEDAGPGIPPQLLSRVFDPFFTTKDVGHGAGLGLYLVQEIVDRHDGCIGVHSAPGKGTRFIVCLPQREQGPEA